jgi:GNAT superfamily N-acetyltransferase
MDIKLIIREFQTSDLPALAILNNELGYPTTEAEMKTRMEDILQNPDCRTAVAVLDNKPVGYMGLNKHFFWEQNGHFIRIQALVVKKELRGTGAGKKLIEYAEAWARETGTDLIFLNCGNKPEREGAHKFYPKMGFEAKSTGYVKRVSKD